jgi:hypothetical protein
LAERSEKFEPPHVGCYECLDFNRRFWTQSEPMAAHVFLLPADSWALRGVSENRISASFIAGTIVIEAPARHSNFGDGGSVALKW